MRVKYKDYNIIHNMKFKSLDYAGTLTVETNIGIEAIFQLRDNYIPLLIYSGLSEKNTYKAMLLIGINNEEIVKG